MIDFQSILANRPALGNYPHMDFANKLTKVLMSVSIIVLLNQNNSVF